MIGLADIYILTDNRSPDIIERFIKAFLPNGKEAAEDYVVPYLTSDNPKYIFDTTQEIISYCCNNPYEEQAIYWNNPSHTEQPHSAMIFFTNDGKLLLGLSTNDEDLAVEYLNKLKDFSKSQIGYITIEEPPALNSEEFSKKAKGWGSNDLPHNVKGS
jgi:hypothetical protein